MKAFLGKRDILYMMNIPPLAPAHTLAWEHWNILPLELVCRTPVGLGGILLVEHFHRTGGELLCILPWEFVYTLLWPLLSRSALVPCGILVGELVCIPHEQLVLAPSGISLWGCCGTLVLTPVLEHHGTLVFLLSLAPVCTLLLAHHGILPWILALPLVLGYSCKTSSPPGLELCDILDMGLLYILVLVLSLKPPC